MEPNEKKTENKFGICRFCGHDQCQVTAIVENGKLKKLVTARGAPFQPLPPVEGCPKAKIVPEFVHHPDRLNFPLKRKGNRGENKWEKISWDQALDEIAKKLENIRQKDGAEAVAAVDGFSGEVWAALRFLHLFGSPNYESLDSRICKGDCRSVNYAIIGSVALFGPPTDSCKCLVQWGSHHSISAQLTWHGEKRLKDLGAKTIVIDPRRTKEAELADIWLQLRPGTDCALGMSWLNIIINEQLYDKEFVSNWTVGFDKLKERVQEYTPKKVQEITWVPLEKIIESARMYALTKPASINWGTKTSHIGRNATEVERVRVILRAITGNLDVDGGDLMQEPNPNIIPHQDLELCDKLPEEQMKKALGSERFRFKTWPGWKLIADARQKRGMRPMPAYGNLNAVAPEIFETILSGKPYPIRALIMLRSNPMVQMGGVKKVYEALKKVELSVVKDVFMTPTAMLADYVLPGTSWFEVPQMVWHEHIEAIMGSDRVIPEKIPGKYDRKDYYSFWRELGIRLGQGDYWPWKTVEEVNVYRLSPLKLSWDEWRKKPWYTLAGIKEKNYEKTGFFTPSGKVELYSSIYEKLGYDPLPHYEEPPESPISTPDLYKKYPYILITSRVREYRHSMLRQISSLRKKYPYPLVEIHPETAKKLGIKEGDWVWIEGVRGKVRQKCKFFDGINPKVVNAEFGWWYPEKPPEDPSLFGVWESNINILASQDLEHCDRSCGNWYMNAMLCNIYKAEELK